MTFFKFHQTTANEGRTILVWLSTLYLGIALFFNGTTEAQLQRADDLRNIATGQDFGELRVNLCRLYPKLGIGFLESKYLKNRTQSEGEGKNIAIQVKTYNLAFIRLHELRLVDDIKSIEGSHFPDPKHWYAKAQKELLLNKRKQLEIAQKAYSNIQNDLTQDEPFHYFGDIETYVNTGKIPLLKINSAGPMVTKTGAPPEQDCNLAGSEIPKNLREVDNFFEMNTRFYEQLCGLKQKPSSLMSEQTSKFFDPSKYPMHQRFLKDLGITGPASNEIMSRKTFDLSAEYPEPQRQILAGNHSSKACVAYALVSDMEYTGKTPALSSDFAYGMIRATHALQYPQANIIDGIQAEEEKNPGTLKEKLKQLPDHLYDKMKKVDNWDAGSTIYDATHVLEDIKIPSLKNSPAGQFFPKSLKAVQGRDYSIKSESTLDVKSDDGEPMINYGFMKLLIDTKNPPAVFVSNEARQEQGEWMRPIKTGGIKHMVNVVGYGEAIDPFDLRKKPYFEIRDSLGSTEIHYKIDADTFLQETEALVKVTEVQK